MDTPATVSELTGAVYGALPQMFRDADEALGYPLLTYYAAQLEQLAAVYALLDRFNFIAPDEGGGYATSDLIDPQLGDAAWLPWQAQLYGVLLDRSQPEATQRDAVGDRRSGWRRGTAASMIAAAQTVLTGTKSCIVLPHYGGDAWTIGLQVVPDEAPADPNVIIDAVLAADAKPAGYELVVDLYQASWATIEADFPTWADLRAAGSWLVIESAR